MNESQNAPDQPNASLVIRPMQGEDTIRMHELHTACLRQICAQDYTDLQIEAWLAGRSPEGYLRMIEDHNERMFVALLDDIVAGFASWRDMEFLSLYVDPDHNGKGIGQSLHQACDTDASSLHRRIMRVDSTLSARGFYERMGYRFVRKTFHLSAGIRIPALSMRRPRRERAMKAVKT